ncbi:GPP34 family phosphoprotein [Pontibacter sp. G13]|uniref:GOLPH3/VPS74 family protein n=1 Tax=Pontibacter sp. G13 TaxID=3074898 RepID=UPI00288ACAEA|nr:GPP34 family phosphoprotein [Pontibacter sp. G13]WNJ17829.1 GPP34 family phosphoprotein [Pontibacter sp. G13]
MNPLNASFSLAEQLIILSHRTEKPNYAIPVSTLSIGICGAMMMDLVKAENIRLEEGKVHIDRFETDLSEAHQMMLDRMAKSKKLRKPSYWISSNNMIAHKFRKVYEEQLVEAEVLRIERKKFLFIPYKITHLEKPETHEWFRDALRTQVFASNHLDPSYKPFLGLIQGCKLYKLIAEGKSEVKEAKSKITELMAKDPLSKGMETAMEEMQAAMIATIIASTTAANVATMSVNS